MSDDVSPRGDFLVEHQRLHTTDLDFAREAVGRMWEYHRSTLLRGRAYDIQWHQADLVDANLSYVRTSSAIRVLCGPVGNTYRVTLHESGRINHWIDGAPAVSVPSRAVVHVPGQELRLDTEPFRLLLLSFGRDVVEKALQTRRQQFSDMDHWPREFSLETPAGISLRALCRWAAGELDRPGYGSLNSLNAKRALECTLLMLLLDCVENASPAESRGNGSLAEVYVGRVEEWIQENLAEPIGVEDLARSAGVSVRSLQVACRRWRGCTPMELLRKRRLEAAHAALRVAAPGRTVTAMASECGFFNFGRFAAHYRAAFGETPSQTLACSGQRAPLTAKDSKRSI